MPREREREREDLRERERDSDAENTSPIERELRDRVFELRDRLPSSEVPESCFLES
jgi:hypothetical protein